jgi:SAM-dependent methyltransferase
MLEPPNKPVSLGKRSGESEWMDDYSIQDERLTDALENLRLINAALGGYATSLRAVAPYLKAVKPNERIKILDVGCGGGDFAEMLLLWCDRHAPLVDLTITGVDLNETTVQWATEQIRSRLPRRLSSKVVFISGDALDLPFARKQFDIAHASLFAHHLSSDQIVALLREMTRTSTAGIVVNDLHRCELARSSIALLTKLLHASAMVQHDAPLSVRRGFTRDELTRIAAAAGLNRHSISWRWAFRWLLTTVE